MKILVLKKFFAKMHSIVLSRCWKKENSYTIGNIKNIFFRQTIHKQVKLETETFFSKFGFYWSKEYFIFFSVLIMVFGILIGKLENMLFQT